MKSLFGTAIFLVCVSLVSSQTWDFDFYANNQNCDGSSKISTVVVAVPGNSCFRVPAYNDFFTIRWVDSVGDFVLYVFHYSFNSLFFFFFILQFIFAFIFLNI